MGPQSSGKSTLLNHVFGTGFQEMDALTGRRQTTKGVWLAKSPKMQDFATLVMDLEGSDGRERGEDDTNFERQSALFALAVSDVLLVNIWCHDIGREQGSGKPLMKTIFQVNLKLFAPEPNRKRSVLLFVIRDKSKTPLPKLVEVLEADLHRMWETISKPPQYTNSALQDFFEVQYAALPNFEEKQEDFLADAVVLRRRFSGEDPDSTLRRALDRLPADAFSLSLQQIWEVIRSQKDLNLPAHKIMVANIRCNELKEEQLRAFTSDQAWLSLVQEAAAALVPQFGALAGSLLDSCIKGYDQEAMYFDEKVRVEKRSELVSKLHSLVLGPQRQQVDLLIGRMLSEFERELKLATVDGAEGFSASAARLRAAQLQRFGVAIAEVLVPGLEEAAAALDKEEGRGGPAAQMEAALDALIESLKQKKIAQVLTTVDKSLAQLISRPAVSLLDSLPQGLWPRLHAARKQAVATAEKALFEGLSGYSLTEAERQQLMDKLADSGRARVESHVREAASTRLSRMTSKFHSTFALDEQNTPRTWQPREDVPAIARQARLAAANVLAQLAVLREEDAKGPDDVESAILRLAQHELDEPSTAEPAASGSGGGGGAVGSGNSSALPSGFDIESATGWPRVAEDDVLIAPHEARATWREFMSSSNMMVQQALTSQQANRLANNKSPPIWALLLIVFLGWNEFMAVLWNPLYLVIGVIGLLFARTLYTELDVDSEMQRGTLPGLISLASKLGPALGHVSSKTYESVTALVQETPGRLQQGLHKLQDGEGLAAAASAAGLSPRRDDGGSSSGGFDGAEDAGSAAGLTRRGGNRRAASPPSTTTNSPKLFTADSYKDK